MSILPVQLVTPAAQVGKAAGKAVVAVGSGFAGLLKGALNPSGGTKSGEETTGNAQTSSTGVASPVGGASVSAELAAFRKQTDEQLNSLQQQLLNLLASNGIDASGGLHLQLDDMNQVRVAGNHPQKHAIEGLFASHPELEDAFREVAARSLALRDTEQQCSGVSHCTPAMVDLYVDPSRTEVGFLPIAE